MEFGEILKKLRKEEGLSQAEMAKKIKVSQSLICHWENGTRMPTKETLEAFGDYFNVDIDYLCGRSEIRQTIHFDKDGNALVYVDDTMRRLYSYCDRMSKEGIIKLEEYAEFLAEKYKK